jgi:hypothetical protein
MEVRWQQIGTVVVSPPAVYKRAAEGDLYVSFLPDSPWTDNPYDNRHPRVVQLGPQKIEGPDGSEVLIHWVLGEAPAEVPTESA